MSRDALVIGINTYDRINSLKSPADDAEAIAQLLTKHGDFKVRRLPAVKKDGNICVGQKTKVTLTQLEEALVQLFKPEGDNIPETALLYFSGHGQRKNRGIQEGFLATSDVNPDLGIYGLSLQWLRRLLQESPIRQQIIWLDCCYSGELLNFAEADPGDRGKGHDRCFIAASREFEVAYEAISGNYSVLTESLLQGLDPKRQPDGLVTNYTLIDHLNSALKSATQRPLYANSGGQIILTGNVGTQSSVPLLGGICPYKGLAYFDCNDSDPNYFYGRTALTDQLLEKVRSGNFLVVLGASGSGKSSVVRAGLVHQLKLGQRLSGSDKWPIYIFRPGEHPLQRLAEAFVEPGLSEVDRATQLAKAQELIRAGAVGLGHLIAAAETCGAGVSPVRVVLVVDQFEEAFTLCQDSTERQQFFEYLLGAVEQADNRLCLVLTMRADFFGKCAEQEYAGLASIIQEHLVTVTPMTREELEQAITEPAKKVGLEVERELVEEMIADVEGSPGSLPLLQYTLSELWNQRIVERLMLSAYTRLGGVKGTLQKRATEVYESFSPDEQQTAKRIFLELTQLGEGTEDTRRQVFQQDLVTSQQSEALVDRVLQKLADAKLVVTSTLSEKGSKSGRVAVVDVAHEALIRHWPLLRQWVNENRDSLRKQRNIEEDAQEWLEKGKSGDYLLRGSKLAEAENFFSSTKSVHLSSIAQEFVKKSIQQQRNRRVRTVGIVAIAMTVLAGTSVFATTKWTEAEKGRVNAQLDSLSFSSGLLFASHLELEALLKSLAVGKQLKTETGVGANTKMRNVAALRELVYSVRERNRLEGHSNRVMSVAWSPDGKTIASASEDKTIKLWSSDGKELATLNGHDDKVLSVSFSPDGKTIASASEDDTIKLWSINGTELNTLKGHSQDVNSVAWSPDGKTIASASRDGTIKLWSQDGKELKTIKADRLSAFGVAWSPHGKILASAGYEGIKIWSLDGKELKTLKGHASLVRSVAWSPNGRTLASASQDKTIKLWSIEDGKELRTFQADNDTAWSVAWSPDGQTLASAGGDSTIKLWSKDGKELATFKGHTSWTTSVTWSPDGKTIASASADGTIKLWDKDSKELATLSELYHERVFSVAWSPDGKKLAVLNVDGIIKLWSKDGTEPITFSATGPAVYDIAWSPDGQTLASANDDSTIQLWNLDGKEIKTLKGHSDKVIRVAWSPDSKMLASASADTTIKLWNLDGKELRTIKGHSDVVGTVAWSPDGQTLASGSADKTIKLWNLDGKELKTFKGHSAWLTSLAWSPDSKMLASASADKTIKLWNLDGKELATLKGHSSAVSKVIFSPDGQTLASASADKTIKLWSLDGNDLATLNGHSAEVSSISFSPDGKILASGSEDKTIILWNLDLDNLMVRGCNWLHDYLNNPNAKISDQERHVCDGIKTSGS